MSSQEIVIEYPKGAAFMVVPEIPIKRTNGRFYTKIELDSWGHHVIGRIFTHWRQEGAAVIYEKGALVDTVTQTYKKMTKERATEIVTKLVEQGLFREEGELLVPEKPLLGHTTSENGEARDPWYCFSYGNRDIRISISETPSSL